MDNRQRFAVGASFSLLAVSVLFLGTLSIIYDFGECWYPSKKSPFFTSGRLMSGVLLPFLLIYLNGLERLFRKTKTILIIVIFIAALILTSEVILSWDIFKSPYNWFH